jgi:hypothetical protein
MTFAHVGGLPIEETLLGGGPALFAVLAAVTATVRARLRRGSGEDES